MNRHPWRFFVIVLAACVAFVAGCSTPVPPQSGRFIQKKPVIIAIIPADNRTDEPAAPLVLDKEWEEALVKWGCMVVNADHVVTYASAQGMELDALRDLPLEALARLGRDLGVDYVMYNTIVDWDTVNARITSHALVSCVSVIYEAKTGAVVWEDSWSYMDSPTASEKSLSNAIVALAHSSLSTMSDGEAAAAANGVSFVMDFSLPYPSFEPGTEYSATKWTSKALLAQPSSVTEESPEESDDSGD
jgi:hypothetical protein